MCCIVQRSGSKLRISRQGNLANILDLDKIDDKTGCPKKSSRFLRKVRLYFPEPFFYKKLQRLSMSFQKEISILSHMAKKLQAR